MEPGVAATFTLSDLIAAIEERRQVEIAIGVLMGLRNCSQDDALTDFGDAVRESRVKAIDLATALIEAADGTLPPGCGAEVHRRWGHLL